MNRNVPTILLCLLLGQACVNATAPAAHAEDPSVEAGREALGHWGRYPWYDAENDALRRIDVAPPEVGFWEWLWELLPDFDWDPGGGLSGSTWGGFMQILAYGLIVVVALVLVYFLVRTFLKHNPLERATFGNDSEKKDPQVRHRIEALPFPIAPDMSNLLEAARHYYERREYGEAAKYLFSYQLVQLDRYSVIRLARGKTNRQYLRELGRGHTLHPHVERTMWVFEEFFFGNRAIKRLQFEACWSGVEHFDTHLASKSIATSK